MTFLYWMLKVAIYQFDLCIYYIHKHNITSLFLAVIFTKNTILFYKFTVFFCSNSSSFLDFFLPWWRVWLGWGPTCSHRPGRCQAPGQVWRQARRGGRHGHGDKQCGAGCYPGDLTSSLSECAPCLTETPSEKKRKIVKMVETGQNQEIFSKNCKNCKNYIILYILRSEGLSLLTASLGNS